MALNVVALLTLKCIHFIPVRKKKLKPELSNNGIYIN